MRIRIEIGLVLVWSIAAAFILPTVVRAEPSASAKREISHLLVYMEKSGCEFNRNGTWYREPRAIRDHVDLKYRHFSSRGKVSSAEAFIQWAASKSEISGKPYLVRCGEGVPVTTSQWLNEELRRFRQRETEAHGEPRPKAK